MIRLKDILTERVVLELPQVEKIATAMGETVTGELGRGANGVAYAMQSGRVLKITPDAAEVALATRLRTKRLFKHIVNVYDVREITPGYYVIIMDQITPFTENHRRIWEEVRYTYMNPEVTDSEFRDDVLDLIAGAYKTEPDSEFIDRIIPQRKSLMRDFNQLRIVQREAHGGNMGWKPGNVLVHYDAWQFEHYTKLSADMQDYANVMGRPLGQETPRNMTPTQRGLGAKLNIDLEDSL